jgi:hypothetical protein
MPANKLRFQARRAPRFVWTAHSNVATFDSKAWQANSSSTASASSSDWSDSESGSGPGSAISANRLSDASTVQLCGIDMPRERGKECSDCEPPANELSSRSPKHVHMRDNCKILSHAAPNGPDTARKGPDALVRFSTRNRRSVPIMSHLIDKQPHRSKYIGVSSSLRVVALTATFIRQFSCSATCCSHVKNPARHLVDNSLDAGRVHARTHARMDLQCAPQSSLCILWAREISRIRYKCPHARHTKCTIGQVRWQAVTQTWWAGVGQRGRSFHTEEEAAMHWSAEFEEPCDGYSACVCTCPTSVYKRVH